MEFLRNTYFDYIFIIIASGISILLFARIIYYTQFNKEKNIFNYRIVKFKLYTRLIFFALWFLSIIIAYLGLVIDFSYINKSVNNKDIIFVLDTSKSMIVQDIKFSTMSRLDYAKSILINFVTKNVGNKYSLYLFAGKTQNISPLTTDTNWFLNNLSSVNTNSITTGWTKIKETIEEIITDYSNDNNNKNIVLLSDGWDDWENEDINSIDLPSKFKIFTIGIWTAKWGYIPNGADLFGNVQYKSYNWELIVSKLNTTVLEELAKKWNWEYSLWFNMDILDIFKQKMLNNNWSITENDWTYIFICISFIFLVLWYLIDYKKTLWKS